MVRVWQVQFDGPTPGPEGDYTLHFVDSHELFKPPNYFALTPEYVDKLQELVETLFNYRIIGNIKTVHTPDGKEWGGKNIWALLGLYSIDQWQDVSLGALISERLDKDWEVLGFHPSNILQFSAINQDFIKTVVHDYTQRPEKFTGVQVITPP